MDQYRDLHIRITKSENSKKTVVWTMYYFQFSGLLDGQFREKELGFREHTWFMFDAKEFSDLAYNKINACQDIGHSCKIYGDCVLFYDLGDSFPKPGVGRGEHSYYCCYFPCFMRIRLARALEAMAARLAPGEDRTIVVPLQARQGWLRRYGQGTGRVKLDASVEQTTKLQSMLQDSTGLAECWAGVCNIAKNSTYRHNQEASVRVYVSENEVGWAAYTPRGERIMNGGIINHGSKEEPSWSSHS